jgi:membrane-bound lytic murein transglycosylase B
MVKFSIPFAICLLSASVLSAAGPSASVPTNDDLKARQNFIQQTTQPAPLPAPPPVVVPDPFQTYLQSLWPKAQAMGIRKQTFDSVVPTLTFHQRVIDLDQAQFRPSTTPSAPSLFTPYRNRQLAGDRISKGREVYQRLRPMLKKVEAETGVPESIMVGIYGHETSYGRVLGNFDLPRALATLAYEGRRRTLFEPEFLATLKMMDMGIPRERLVGSWAGAFGLPQFLPTVYLKLGIDGDGDGKSEIWNNEADAVASIGNYLRNAGWRAGEPWGIAVNVPDSLDRAPLRTKMAPTKCRRVMGAHSKWQSMREWREMGLVPVSASWPDDDVLATLLEPDGQGKTAYLLTGNYRAVLDYNCSNHYALTVGLIANAVSQ